MYAEKILRNVAWNHVRKHHIASRIQIFLGSLSGPQTPRREGSRYALTTLVPTASTTLYFSKLEITAKWIFVIHVHNGVPVACQDDVY